MIKIKRYWIQFSNPPLGNVLAFGCGISAIDREHALQILDRRIFSKTGVLQIKSIQNDVDIRSLDQQKIIPNMGDVTAIGVWFP